MKRPLQYLLIAVVALAAATAGYLTRERKLPAAAEAPAQDAAAELLALSLPDAGGQPQALAQWKGKVVVANFWATWCPPCREEIPDFAALSRSFADAPVQFVGISLDTPDKVSAFAREIDVPYPLLIAPHDVLGLTRRLGNSAQALPFTVIVDREGRLRHVKLGILKRTELEGKIRSLLDPAAS